MATRTSFIGDDCSRCEGILTKQNTEDWGGEAGNCDSCIEKAQDSSCVWCGSYCHCDSDYDSWKDRQLD